MVLLLLFCVRYRTNLSWRWFPLFKALCWCIPVCVKSVRTLIDYSSCRTPKEKRGRAKGPERAGGGGFLPFRLRQGICSPLLRLTCEIWSPVSFFTTGGMPIPTTWWRTHTTPRNDTSPTTVSTWTLSSVCYFCHFWLLVVYSVAALVAVVAIVVVVIIIIIVIYIFNAIRLLILLRNIIIHLFILEFQIYIAPLQVGLLRSAHFHCLLINDTT